MNSPLICVSHSLRLSCADMVPPFLKQGIAANKEISGFFLFSISLCRFPFSSPNPIPSRRQNSIRVKRVFDVRAYVGKRFQPPHRFFLEIKRRTRDRVAQLCVCPHQCTIARNYSPTLFRVLTIKDDHMEGTSHARAAHILGNVLQLMFSQDSSGQDLLLVSNG